MTDAAEELARKHGTTTEEVESYREQLLKQQLPSSKQPRVALMLAMLLELTRETVVLRIQLGRTQGLIFGQKTEKKKRTQSSREPSEKPGSSEPASAAKPEQNKPGHGRLPAQAYSGAQPCSCPHPHYSAGDRCPRCGGTLRAQKPSIEIRIIGAPPLGATRYELERLRCDTCGWVVTAPLPPEAPPAKYDSSAVSMMGLYKYGTGMPFYRMARLQEALGVPVPESTQWELLRDGAQLFRPLTELLWRQAADAELVFIDDTPMKILNRQPGERKSTQTTVIIARCAGHWIYLYETGTRHAGNNLQRLFACRSPGLPPPIQMSDALACNTSHVVVTWITFCLTHARRYFFDIQAYFPDICEPLLEKLGQIYHWEQSCQSLDKQQRLEQHRRYSLPLMNQIKACLETGLETRQIEPNSSLGKAAAYFLKHWDGLTGFCRIPGAPLDNGPSERALKLPVLNRKNSYFFKTNRGARVADTWMSLIKTARCAGANPFDYLTYVQENARRLASNPEDFLPWNLPLTDPPSILWAARAGDATAPPA